MKYKFKQAALFHTPSESMGAEGHSMLGADGKPSYKKDHHFPLGVHEVPKEVEEHHYFQTLKKAGLVEEVSEAPLLSQAQKNEMLANKAVMAEAEEALEVPEDSSDEKHEAPSKHKSKSKR